MEIKFDFSLDEDFYWAPIADPEDKILIRPQIEGLEKIPSNSAGWIFSSYYDEAIFQLVRIKEYFYFCVGIRETDGSFITTGDFDVAETIN